MARSTDSIEMKLKLQRAREFQRGVNKSARAVDNLGDQAGQAARKMAKLNAASAKTRVNLGPFSTSMRFASVAVGGFMLAVQEAVPLTLSLAEAVVTMGAGAAAAGLVGLTALGQGAVVAKFGLKDLTDALGGNEEALKRLGPEARDLFNTLHKAQNTLKVTTNANLFPGLQAGAQSAMRNLPVLNKIVGQTATVMGGLGRDAGRMIGSKAFGKDLATVGTRNTRIIDNLGHAGLALADAARHIIVEAGPLAEWMSKMILRGAKLTDEWIKNKRQTGDLAKFFRRARTDISLLVSATGHLAGGVLNLFGHQDVDGTNTLRNLDRLMARFEEWTRSIAGKPLGPELQHQMELALGGLASFVGSHMGQAGKTAAGAFVHAFWAADAWGKGITAAYFLTKIGLTKKLLGGVGSLIFGGIGSAAGAKGKGGVANALTARGTTPANPLYVLDIGSATPGGKTVADKVISGAKKGGALRAALGLGARVGGPLAFLFGAAEVAQQSGWNEPGATGTKLPAGAGAQFNWGDLRNKPTGRVRQSDEFAREVENNVTVQNHITIKEPDGRTYRATSRGVAKRGAKKKQRATGVARAIPGFGAF